VQLATTDDEFVLAAVVGDETFRRGREYVRTGAVLQVKTPTPTHAFGSVAGTAPTPYSAVAVIGRSSDGDLETFRGNCTCPVRLDCKHAVALALRALLDSGTAFEVSPPAPVTSLLPAWERRLNALVADEDGDDNRADAPPIALQFELAAGVGRGPGARAPALGLRPVLPGKKGGWVRSGISWNSLTYPPYPLRDQASAQLRLLREIVSLSMWGRTTTYGYQSQPLFLEDVDSRRIWDILAEAQDAGLPLVHAGKQGRPVRLVSEPVEVVLDVSRADGDSAEPGLILRTRLTSGEEQLALASTLLLGNPAHGVAWWQHEGEKDPRPTEGLRLARLAAPIDDRLRRFLDEPELVVPRSDEAHFLGRYYPALRRRIRVASSDPAVTLPEPSPPTLHLRLEHLEDHRLDLLWEWRYTLGDAVRTQPLWPGAGPPADRDAVHEAAVLDLVAPAAKGLAALWEAPTDPARPFEIAEPRLREVQVLVGMTTVRFLTEVLPALAELADLTIETIGEPTEYREAEAAPVVEISEATSDASGRESGERDWFDLDVTVSVDGEDVPFEALFVALVAGQSEMVLPSGTWFPLDRPELQTLADLIVEARALQDHPRGVVRLSRYQAGLWEELDRTGVITGQAAEWQRSVRVLNEVAELPDPPTPQSLRATLRPYQQIGFSWLSFLFEHRLGGVLADEMGLGKTVQALALICRAKEVHDVREPFLVVAPTSVVANWAAECRRFAPDLAVRVISETKARRGRGLAAVARGADIVLTSYTLFRLEENDYAAQDWAGLILDEAQFVKNHQSRAHQCAKRLPTPFKLAITGTPMENNLMELWSLLSIAAPGLFASPVRFEKAYRTPIEKEKDTRLLGQLRRRVKPFMLRRSKEEVVRDLPAKQEQVVELTLNAKHRKVYQTHLQRERQKVLGLLGDLEKNRFEVFRSLTLLRQACLDAALVDPDYAAIPSTKLDALVEQLTEIASEGHRTLVFSQFTRFLSAARKRVEAAGLDSCYLDGSTRNRAAVLEEFRSGTAPVFFISLKAGGFGLNLTEADYCILLDPWWNPATEAQAVDRVHRIGQTKQVMVYRLLAKDTIEEKVMALKAAKAELFTSVLEGGEFTSAALSAADIRRMLE
jgi:superfamily II DNA or RNA helicase